ncbi:hypothetical protein GVAV_001745 [Gurleya vavrai]
MLILIAITLASLPKSKKEMLEDILQNNINLQNTQLIMQRNTLAKNKLVKNNLNFQEMFNATIRSISMNPVIPKNEITTEIKAVNKFADEIEKLREFNYIKKSIWPEKIKQEDFERAILQNSN